MPINVNKPQVIKRSTPLQKVRSGEYPAVIAGVIYPRFGNEEQHEKMRFLMQLTTCAGTCYIATRIFNLSLDEKGFFFNFMRPMCNATSSEDLVDWLRKNDMVDEDGTFDERYLIGYPCMAAVDSHASTENSRKVFQTVTAIKSAPIEYKVDIEWKVPSAFGPGSYDGAYADGLEIDSDNADGKEEYEE
jgi:hypothetical protein